jgi:hypothetical protein
MQARWPLRGVVILSVLATAVALARPTSGWSALRASAPLAMPAASFEIVCEGLTGPERLNALMAGDHAAASRGAAIGCGNVLVR